MGIRADQSGFLSFRPTRRRLLGAATSGLSVLLLGPHASSVVAQDATPTPCSETSTEESIAIAQAYFDAFNAGDIDAIGALLADNYQHRGALVSTQDRASHLDRIAVNLAAFPDADYSIEDITANGDLVAVRSVFRGTLQGPYAGVEPEGQPVAVRAVHIHRIACGQIVETWNSGDGLGLLRQIGALPGGPAAKTPEHQAATPIATPSAECMAGNPEENAEVARRWTEALAVQDLDLLDEFVSEDLVHHSGFYVDSIGREALKDNFRDLFSAFPDVTFTVDVVVADEEGAVVRWTGSGTNDGSFQGQEPTGLPVTFTGINSYRIACGIIIEGWSDTDSLQLLQQLGFVGDIYPGPATPVS